MPRHEATTSNEPSSYDRRRQSMTSNDALRTSSAAAFRRAKATIPSARSTPATRPSLPTRRIASKARFPVPHPRSRRRSPGCTSASSRRRSTRGALCGASIVFLRDAAVLFDEETGGLLVVHDPRRAADFKRTTLALSRPSPALRLMAPMPSEPHGPHGPDVPPPPRDDPERLDGLSTRVAGEGPGSVRPRHLEGEAACERRELLRPHGPDGLGDPVRPPGD